MAGYESSTSSALSMHKWHGDSYSMGTSSISPLHEVMSFGWLHIYITDFSLAVIVYGFYLLLFIVYFSLLDDLWINEQWPHTGRLDTVGKEISSSGDSVLNKPECNAALMFCRGDKRSKSSNFWCLSQRSTVLFGTVLSTAALILQHWPGDVAAIHHR